MPFYVPNYPGIPHGQGIFVFWGLVQGKKGRIEGDGGMLKIGDRAVYLRQYSEKLKYPLEYPQNSKCPLQHLENSKCPLWEKGI